MLDKNEKRPYILTLCVRLKPDAEELREELLPALDSVFSHIGGKAEDIQIILAADKLTDSKVAKLNASMQSANIEYELCAYDKVHEFVRGEYFFAIDQGDVFLDGAFARIIDLIKKERRDVFVLRLGRRDSDFISIYSEPYQVVWSASLSILNSSGIKDFAAVLRCDFNGILELNRMIIADEGYFLETSEIMGIDPMIKTPVTGLKSDTFDELCSFSEEKFGEIAEYLQALMLTAIGEEIKNQGSAKTVKSYLHEIDDSVIMSEPSFDLHKKIYVLGLKYDTDVRSEMTIDEDDLVWFRGVYLFKVSGRSRFNIKIIDIHGRTMLIQGITDLPSLCSNRFRLKVSDKNDAITEVELSPFEVRDEYGLDGECYFRGMQFKIELPIKYNNTYEIMAEDQDGSDIKMNMTLGNYSRLNHTVRDSFFVKNGYIVSFKNNALSVQKYRQGLHAKKELKYQLSLMKKGKIKPALYRMIHVIYKQFQNKPVWIVADRPHVAKDNGEHMFRYIMKTDVPKTHDVYFLISKSSPDYPRLKAVGKVLKYDSIKHKMKFLQASIIIAAAANNLAINPFGKSGQFYRDLYDFEFVYLRHGVSHNDQSAWLNNLNKHMRILVATCRPEYRGILEGPYGYTEREVKLTGLPRYDNLKDERQKEIAILPTWRKNLQGELIPRTSKRAYIRDFKETDYYRFYQSLIDNEKLHACMKKYGYKGCFYLHPVFEAQYRDFKGSDLIKIGNGIADYQEIFKRSSLMITDFSSVAFDFAFLKKPVIYSQFDETSFYLNHSWGKGYFTYREDGFGPVTTTLDETIDTLIEYIEKDCSMKDEYIERVDNFFAYSDHNNCKRVFDAIMEVEKESEKARR